MPRVGVVLVAFPAAWLVAEWSVGFTLSGPLPSGGYEGTPATLIVGPAVLIVTFAVIAIGGNPALSVYFRSRGLPKT